MAAGFADHAAARFGAERETPIILAAFHAGAGECPQLFLWDRFGNRNARKYKRYDTYGFPHT